MATIKKSKKQARHFLSPEVKSKAMTLIGKDILRFRNMPKSKLAETLTESVGHFVSECNAITLLKNAIAESRNARMASMRRHKAAHAKIKQAASKRRPLVEELRFMVEEQASMKKMLSILVNELCVNGADDHEDR